MNGGKLLLIVATMAALGVLVLPSTVSMFAGQHYWYNISDKGNQIPCEKCHADVFEELSLSEFHTHWGTGGLWNTSAPGEADRYDCEACHRSNLSIQYAVVGRTQAAFTDYQPGKQAHAASVVACMLCHQIDADQATSAPGYYAGGFNISEWENKGIISSPFNYSNASNPGTFEAHNAFIAMAIKNGTLQDSNEACIACHTHVAVKINWTHARSLEFDVSLGEPATTEEGPHNWTITNWDYNRTAKATVWGNTSGYGSTSYYNEWPGNVDNIYD